MDMENLLLRLTLQIVDQSVDVTTVHMQYKRFCDDDTRVKGIQWFLFSCKDYLLDDWWHLKKIFSNTEIILSIELKDTLPRIPENLWNSSM